MDHAAPDVRACLQAAVQLLFVVTSVVGLVWYNRLRHQLSHLEEFSDDSAFEKMLMEEDVQAGGRGAVTALKTFVSDDSAAPGKISEFRGCVLFASFRFSLANYTSALPVHLLDHSMQAKSRATVKLSWNLRKMPLPLTWMTWKWMQMVMLTETKRKLKTATTMERKKPPMKRMRLRRPTRLRGGCLYVACLVVLFVVTPPKCQHHRAVSLIFQHALGNAPIFARSYLVARYYTRRFSIVIYETCVCVLATVVLILGVIDSALLTSDPILFAVTFVLVSWTWALSFETRLFQISAHFILGKSCLVF